MKKSLVFLALIGFSTLPAQMITHKSSGAGLLDPNGMELLPPIYDDITEFEQFGTGSNIFILWNNGKFGLFCADSHQQTECKYDRIFPRGGILVIEDHQQFGFVAQPNDSQYSVVEPVYTSVWPMSGGFHSGEIISIRENPISVRKDSLWGVLSSASGRELLPCTFPYAIEQRIYDPFWVMQYPDSYKELLINPKTGATIPSQMDYKTRYNYSNNTLLVYATIPYDGNTRIPLEVNVYNFESGFLIWSYSSQADDITVEYLNDETIRIDEEFGNVDINRNDGRKVYSFYNITNSALLLRYEGGEQSRLECNPEGNKYTVYASKTYNGRKQEIGTIYR